MLWKRGQHGTEVTERVAIPTCFYCANMHIILFYNIWAKVVLWFSKMEMLKQILLCLISVRYQTVLPHHVSGVGLFRLVRFAT